MSRVTALVLCLPLALSACSSAPSDDSLVDRFEANKATYERLRDLLTRDVGLAEVGRSGVRTADSPTWVVPPASSVSRLQYQQYMDLLKSVGASRASRSNGPHPEICIGVWASGWAADTKHKNICWLNDAPTGKGRFVKIPIESNWYLEED
jgi:hypothetical protein